MADATVYLSNLPFAYTNNDVAQLVEACGKIARITIVKDKVDRHRSKGVAFVQFARPESIEGCIAKLDGAEVGGRRLKAQQARDNGRSGEFSKRKSYKDLSKCFECGENGHLSYSCPRNKLGFRVKATRKRKRPTSP